MKNATYTFLILRLIPPHSICNAAWPCWLRECQIRRAGEQCACLPKILKERKRLMIPNDLGAESVEILADCLVCVCVADDRLCG